MNMTLEASPIIVYGAPRSGTTYLLEILNRHPEVFISKETRVFVWAHRSLNKLTQEFYALFQERERFVDYLRGKYPKLIRDFYQEWQPNARYWGDKNPHYAAAEDDGCLETIVTLFPEAKFVHIVRDGRGVVSSILKKEWKKDLDSAHQWWIDHVDVGCKFGRSLPSTQYFEFRYEDLIQDDVLVARQLFEFLDIPIHEQVVDFCRAQQQKRTPINEPVRELNSASSFAEWERILTIPQQIHSLEVLGDRLIRFGYEDQASLAEKIAELTDLATAEVAI